MAENHAKGLKDERKRRKRISRIKNGIMITVSLWLVFSMVICFSLLLRVGRLEDKLNYLLDNFTVSGQVDAEAKQNAAEADESAYYEYDTQSAAGTGEDSYPVVQAANQKENLAKEGDILKVYLTFDDGPSEHTEEILDILDKYGVKASFFVIGKEGEEYRSLYQEIANKGHTLGMHSYSHKYSALYQSLESFEEDFSRIQNYLYEVTGQECLFYRFPGGSSNKVSNTDMSQYIHFLNEQGITYFDWNVSSGDATSQAYTKDELVDNVVKDVVKYKTSIVLMHDTKAKATTVEALGPMIEALQGMGAQILPIDEDTTVIQHIAAASVEER